MYICRPGDVSHCFHGRQEENERPHSAKGWWRGTAWHSLDPIFISLHFAVINIASIEFTSKSGSIFSWRPVAQRYWFYVWKANVYRAERERQREGYVH